MIRVLLVDDSVVQREILRRILGGDNTFTIVGEACDGKEAVRMVEEHRPDVVIMDIHMPVMNGVEATREIMRRFPVPIVIASATLKKRDMDLGLEALNAGAFSVIAKPEGAVLLNLEKISPKLREEILAASRVKLKPAALHPPVIKKKGEDGGTRARIRTEAVEAIGICTSTGGPPVLIDILSALSRPFSIPILLVQHITQGFEESFAVWLSQRSGQPVSMAADGQRLCSGVWLAPSGTHLTLGNSWFLTLLEQKPADIHCPSGNPLFVSLARHLGSRAAGILLTGMGDDGAKGLLELKQAGGTTVIQDEASSFIWGMPKAGKDLQAATYEINPREIALLMTEMDRKSGGKRKSE
jgi:two-component system, chemotaxis family, protein-glutamate methylesterase/glutaminase